MTRAIHFHRETAPQRGQWKIECNVATDRLAAQAGRQAGGRVDGNSDDIKLAPSDVRRLCSIARGRGGVCGRSFIVFAITKDTLHSLATAQYAVERIGHVIQINEVLDTGSLKAPAPTYVSDRTQRRLGATLPCPSTATGTLHHCRDAPLVRSPSRNSKSRRPQIRA